MAKITATNWGIQKNLFNSAYCILISLRGESERVLSVIWNKEADRTLLQSPLTMSLNNMQVTAQRLHFLCNVCPSLQ